MQEQSKKNQTLEQLYGFLGSSLLGPMAEESAPGISADFWKGFPSVSSLHAEQGVSRLIAYTQQAASVDRAQAIERVAVEYTQLFVGPPAPAAPPWETLNKEEGRRSAFGKPTFAMKQRLREAGLELNNTNNQHEDHLGIELLYLSTLCGRSDEKEGACVADAVETTAFIEEHPLAWIETLRQKIDDVRPNGYYSGLVELTQGVLEWHRGGCNEADAEQ